MSSSPRGLRLIKALEHYVKSRPNQFDTNVVLSKIQIQSASEGCMRGILTVDSSMCNSMDTLHGGFICSVFDAMATYAQLSGKNGRLSWTTGLQTHFIKPARKGERVLIETTSLISGTHSVMETTLRNEANGTLLAKGTVDFVAGADKFQKMAKDVLKFDVYEEKGERVLIDTTPLISGTQSVMETTLRNEANGTLLAKGTVDFVAGTEKFQEMAKNVLKFDVYEE